LQCALLFRTNRIFWILKAQEEESSSSSTGGWGEAAHAIVWVTLGWWCRQFLVTEELRWLAPAAAGSGPRRPGKGSWRTSWMSDGSVKPEEVWRCRAREGKRRPERSSSNTSSSFPTSVARGGQSSRRGRALALAEEGKEVLLCARRQWPGTGPSTRMWRMTRLSRWYRYF
jgi:hypothetical protein